MICKLIVVACTLLASAAPASAQAEPPERELTLTVGTKVAPPFVMKGPDGDYRGLSISLLDSIAEDVGFGYEIREYDLPGLLDATARGEVDLAASATTITAERERLVDFTHPFYTAGLAIAVRDEGGINWLRTLRGVFSPTFLSAIAALTTILLGTGALMWLAERKRNQDQFGGGLTGIGHGFWWSAVTMTTVGYGDKAPITLAGRLIALVWMFTSVIIISGFTAAIATSLTLNNMGSDIQSPDDLRGKPVGAVAGSTSEESVRSLDAKVRTYPTGPEAVAALADGEVEAVVHDEPVLRWWLSTADSELTLVKETFDPQDYGFATPPGSELRERVSRAILDITSTEEWARRVERTLSGGE